MWEWILKVLGYLKHPKYNTDSLLDKLSHRFLFVFLLSVFVVTIMNGYFGSRMECFSLFHDMDDLMSSSCWSQGTWLYSKLEDAEVSRITGSRDDEIQSFRRKVEVFPGVRSKSDGKPDQIHHTAYAYLPFIFLGLALSCQLGKLAWKWGQGNTIEYLIRNLDNPTLQESAVDEIINYSAKRFVSESYLHNRVSNLYALSKFINLSVLVFQLLVSLLFFSSGDFLFGYTALMNLCKPYDKWPYSLAKSFPQVTKCYLTVFGIGGSVETYDGICYLAYNKINMVSFATHWWVLVVLIPFTAMEICSHLLITFFPKLRHMHVIKNLNIHPSSDVSNTVKKLEHGSTFVLLLMAKTIPIDYVCRIILEISYEMEYVNERL